MRFLELKIPPPIVALVTGLLGWLIARATPALNFGLPFRSALVSVFAVAGVSVALAGVVTFRRAKTTLNPLKPEQASSLVCAGIYRYTRNPMYLGLLLALLAWTLFLANGAAFLLIPIFILYLNRFQIRPEERALASIFGTEFATYQGQTRRWL